MSGAHEAELIRLHEQGLVDLPDRFEESEFAHREYLVSEALSAYYETHRLAVCTSYFNPCGYASRRNNYLQFAAAAASQRADLHTIELRIEGSEWDLLDDTPNLLRVEAKSVMWHKERMLNLLISQLPDRYTMVAWIDCDILFDNPDWILDTCLLLADYQVVQLFDRAVWLDRCGVPKRSPGAMPGISRISFAYKHREQKEVSLGCSHPGFAWAARRSSARLFDQTLLNCADTVMAYGFCQKEMPDWIIAGREAELADEWRQWADQAVAGSVSYVPGTIRHLWHGDWPVRGYANADLIELAGSARESDFIDSPGSVREWSTEANSKIRCEFESHFDTRSEDG